MKTSIYDINYTDFQKNIKYISIDEEYTIKLYY